VTTERLYEIILAYKSIQFLLVIAIALIFSQVFISGMLLNFLIFMPYLRSKLIKSGKSLAAKADHEARLLSGQIFCLEFTRALYNSICGLFYILLVASILLTSRTLNDDIKSIMW